MTAREFLLKQLSDSEKQLSVAIKGLDAEMAEARPYPDGMTIREQLHHLAETTVATIAAYEGREHEWGTWDPENRSWEGVKEAWRTGRQAAIASLPDTEEGLWEAHAYLLAHDYYHVGQIAAARRTVQPGWTSFELYE